MIWTEEHNIMLCREMLVVEPYQYKIGSRERGNCWDMIATNLNGIGEPRFIVDKRAVRDHFLKLLRDFKRKMAAEERASGINPEASELDEALETIIGRMEGAEEEIARNDESKSKEVERERAAAENVRKRAMESFGESREREGLGGPIKKRVDKDREAMHYLKGRNDEEIEVKKMEMALMERKLILQERAQEENIALKKKELEMKEQEGKDRQIAAAAAAEERENRLISLIQQQQLLFSQIAQQNQLLLDLIIIIIIIIIIECFNRMTYQYITYCYH